MNESTLEYIEEMLRDKVTACEREMVRLISSSVKDELDSVALTAIRNFRRVNAVFDDFMEWRLGQDDG